MSDERINELQSIVKYHTNKLSELEQKVKDWEFTNEGQEILGRISELEKRLDQSEDGNERMKTEIDEIKMMTKHTHPVFKKEIAELRKHISNIDKHASDGRLSLLKQLNELKEQIKHIHEWQEADCDVKEVLRELFYSLELYIKGNIDKRKVVKDLRMLKEKLEGKTEKKEPTPALDALLHGIDPAFLEASGGDNIVPDITQNRELCMKVSSNPLSNEILESKPPEFIPVDYGYKTFSRTPLKDKIDDFDKETFSYHIRLFSPERHFTIYCKEKLPTGQYTINIEERLPDATGEGGV